MVPVVPQDYRSKPHEYGETKKQKQFLLTPTASDLLDKFAAEYGSTRSDLLERLIRGFDAAAKDVRDVLLQGGEDA